MREFAADFEYEPDPDEGLDRRARELYRYETGAQVWPQDDLGLMLYDIFDPEDRSEGFRWLHTEKSGLNDNRQRIGSGAKPLKKNKSQSRFQNTFEGKMIKPKSLFFHARIQNSRLNCNPATVKFV